MKITSFCKYLAGHRSSGGDVNNTIWQGVVFNLVRDMSLNMDLTPLNNNPNHEDIGLKKKNK